MQTSSRHDRAGTSPGTLRAVPSSGPPSARAISYGEDGVEEFADVKFGEIAALRGKRSVLWVDVNGLGDASLIKQLGTAFGLHELALEDVLAVHHRAKLDRFDEYLFMVVRMPEFCDEKGLETDQLSIFLGNDFVLSFQGRPGDCFDSVRERIRTGKGRLRRSGPDYLMYALVDAVIDSYYPVIEHIGDRLDELEDAVLDRPSRALTAQVHGVRRDLLVLRRAVWPMREILNEMQRDEDTPPALHPFLRDCYDHVVELIDLIETYRDLSAGLMEVYVSIVGNRMNEIMKVLTIISTIFIPLSFIASIYGMNFDTSASPYNMPELHWRFGYPLAIGIMLVVGLLLLGWFWRRGWMSRSDEP